MRCLLCGTPIPSGKTKCPLCGTMVKGAEPEGRPAGPTAKESRAASLEEAIPSVSLPDIKNTCPLCANEIKAGETRCPRCGVPLKSQMEPPIPPREAPPSAPRVIPAPPPETVPEEPVIVAPPPSQVEKPLPPEPLPPPEPPRSLEPPEEIVTPAPSEMKVSSVGLTNGRGATNGTAIASGRGMVNGTGLVNGTGMINGTKAGGRQASPKAGRSVVLKRWQFLAILIAIVIVLPTFIYLSYARHSELAVDGDFGEWSKVTKFGMQAPATLPEVTVNEWAVKSDANALYMYLETESDVVGTSNVDSFYLFVDSDGSSGSGYTVSSIGAEYMFELHGWDGKIESASLMQFDSATDSLNWTSWKSIDSLAVRTKDAKMEAMANLPISLTSNSRFVLLAQDNLVNQAWSVSYPVPEKGGSLIIVQETGPDVNALTGLIPSTSSVSLARLVMKCEGVSGTVTSISPLVVGAGLVSGIADISLSPGESKDAWVTVDTSSTPWQTLVSASVVEAGVSSTFEEVVIMGDPVKAYVSSPPTSIHIDGAFGDWAGHVTTDNDSQPVLNSNIDMNGVGSVNATAFAAFFVSVEGQIFQGSCVPATRGKPTSQGGGGPVIPQRKSGEDLLRIFIDIDISNTTGDLVQRSSKVIGADYLLEIDGVNGVIVSKTLMVYSFGVWMPVTAAILAAADSQRVEASVPSVILGGGAPFVAIVETTDWRERSDWAWTGTVPDPWVIDANGTTYMSSDGTNWSYLGAPTLEAGDSIVDIAVTTTGDDVYLVTNTGRTYYWTFASSTNWTLGQNKTLATADWPVGVAYSEAVSITFYGATGAYLLTKNGSFFYVQKADGAPPHADWKWYGYVNQTESVTDFVDFQYDKAGTSAYAIRSAPNSRLSFSASGNAFTSWTSPTGSTSNQTDLYFIGSSTNTTDRVFVLCENGNIRYSSNGGQTWSALGNLPAPTGGNTTKYVALGIDPDGYLWAVTDTGYTYRSTDTTTYSNFVCVGKSPIGAVVALFPSNTVIPEFPMLLVPILAIVGIVVAPRIIRRRLE